MSSQVCKENSKSTTERNFLCPRGISLLSFNNSFCTPSSTSESYPKRFPKKRALHLDTSINI
ncbi:hypothetical protein CP8484711_0590 [Chlamydia psittaci 84-8471/1]|nr:hypothetical protein CPC1998_1065 [Chlamydia psittaci C19/98]EPP32931.1 hypothetical protein CP8484711_0590 [Chlamydia psittaci 84-8471/1]